MSGGWNEQVGECIWNSPDEKTPEEIDPLKVEKKLPGIEEQDNKTRLGSKQK